MNLKKIKISSLLKKKKIMIFSLIFLLFVMARAALPSFLLKKSNKFLADFSPTYALHMEDLDISIIRGAFRFQGITGKVKEDDQKFLNINTVDVSIAWREIFKGRILTDIKVEKCDFLVIKNIAKLSSPKKEARDIKNNFFPVKVERLDLLDMSVSFEGYESIKENALLNVSNINGRVTNLTPTKDFPLSFFVISANVVDPTSKFNFVGEINQTISPFEWNLDMELRDFNLTVINPYLKRHVPLTFTKGSLDLYSEVVSTKGKIKGYAKPFFKDLDVVANKEEFKGPKHFGFEILTALSNLITREPKTKSVATVLDFTLDDKLKFKMGKSVAKAIEHGFKQQIPPGIEDRYNIK